MDDTRQTALSTPRRPPQVASRTRLRALLGVTAVVIGVAINLASCVSAAEPAEDSRAVGAAPPPGLEEAIFAGGCFWCMEPPYDHLDGVVSTTSGYTGGKEAHPTYEQVSAGSTGHTEAVSVIYDPKKVSYEKLLSVYWVNVDPTVKDRQFCDSGSQYRPEIFYRDEAQKSSAEKSKAEVSRTKTFAEPIVVAVTSAGTFWPAEGYHQDYYLKNPLRYKLYRAGCGRDARLKALWGDLSGG